MKKFLSVITAAAVIVTAMFIAVPVQAAEQGAASAANYYYKITPLLEPFNQYFFVETDNPDPESFRFIDKSTVYSEDAGTVTWCDTAFADIKYENAETLRVNGGYIFSSFSTDGGTITLQEFKQGGYSWDSGSWKDTSVTLTLPKLVDEEDYLINTYADKDSFFDNMYAVQSGFSSICLYSGSRIRGTLKRTDDYWLAAAVGHIDQSLYIYSPYEREDSKALFATYIYPFRHDSLGFPSVMASVSKRLDSSSTYKWSESYHYPIDVTYNGETKSFGGAGEIEGQGISEDKIKQYFTFGKNGTKITLDSVYGLLIDYSNIEMDDDIPREDALTWKQISDTVGSGAWVRVLGSGWKTNGKWDLINPVYTYLYTKNDGTFFSSDEFGAGDSLYWGGDLGYSKDVWVDGRYVSVWRRYVPGEKFEDHPTSNIFFTEITIPQVKYTTNYSYNWDAGRYESEDEVTEITEKKTMALFRYDSSSEVWTPDGFAFDDGCAYYYKIQELVEEGKLDKKYLDMVTLTKDQVKALNVDKNTDIPPQSGYIFDGTAPCGTPFNNNTVKGDVDNSGKLDINDATTLQRHLAEYRNSDGSPIINEADKSSFAIADMNADGVIDIRDVTAIQRKIADFEDIK